MGIIELIERQERVFDAKLQAHNRAKECNAFQLTLQPVIVAVVTAERKHFGANRNRYLVAIGMLGKRLGDCHLPTIDRQASILGVNDLGRQQVECADERGDKVGLRKIVNLERAGILLNATKIHDHHAVGQAQRGECR